MATTLKVNLPDESLRDLEMLARLNGTTITEALKSAIATEAFLKREVAKGKKVLIEQLDGKYRQVLFG